MFVRVASLKWARKQAKLSQAALAVEATEILQAEDPEATISESLIALIETGRRQPSVRNCKAIVAALAARLGDMPLEVICDIADDEVAA